MKICESKQYQHTDVKSGDVFRFKSEYNTYYFIVADLEYGQRLVRISDGVVWSDEALFGTAYEKHHFTKVNACLKVED